MRPSPDHRPGPTSPNDPQAPPLVWITARTAAAVCAVADLDEEPLALLTPTMTPRGFLDELLARELYNDAIRFLATALPHRGVVWWGCLCLRLGVEPAPPAMVRALATVVRWVVQPDEANHQEASRLVTEEDEPWDYLLRAVAWTGGSLTPAPLPPVPPDPVLPARAIHAAVMVAASRGPPEKIGDQLRQFLALGIHIARGKYGWPEKPPPLPVRMGRFPRP